MSSITADEIIALSHTPTATLPTPLPLSSLLSLLSSSPTPPFLSSLLSLLSRSPPTPFPSSLLAPSLLPLLSPSFPSSHVPSLTPLFLPLFPLLHPSTLPSLLDLLTSNLSVLSYPNAAALLDLLPPLVTLGVSNYGFPAVSPFVERLLAADWSKGFLLKLSSVLRDLPQDAAGLLPDFLYKIFSGMSTVDIQDLPSLIYQLLLLASKGVCRRDVIGGVLRFFGGHVKGPGLIVRQVKGTVLMHVNFAVKQDLSLGQEIVATVRSDVGGLNHFTVNVLLSVARVKRYSDSVMNALRSAIVDSSRDVRVSRDCKWLPKCIKEQCLQTAKCAERAIMKAVIESNGGREHVIPGFVQLGFLLLESADSDSSEKDNPKSRLMGIQELGIQMLKSLYEIHEMARTEVIQQCKYRILSLKPQQSIQVIRLLGCLIQSYRYTILEYVSHLKELLDYFAYMHERTAAALINSMLPLVRSNRELQDYIILVVRKAMFKREESVRVAAAKAIIDLILIQTGSGRSDPYRMLDSSSQASSSQQVEVNSGLCKRLFEDLSGLFRRCLSQQIGKKEIYDCFDIYKQPAFDHPLLSNHTIQLEPSVELNEYKDRTAGRRMNLKLGLRTSCPEGTVPIRRISKKNLLRAKRYANVHKKTNFHPTKGDSFGDGNTQVMAILYSGANWKYYGVEALMDVYDLSWGVKQDQGSTGQVLLIKGEDGPADYINTIQFGWGVDYQLNGDLSSRFFVFWTSDGYGKKGCSNLLCPGYVQISKGFSPGMMLPAGKEVIKLAVHRDPHTLNWLLLKRNGADSELIGYFPKEIFNNMADASQIQIGGIVYSPDNDLTVPPMGSGVLPTSRGDVCEFKQVAVMDGKGEYNPPASSKTWLYQPHQEFYGVATPKNRPTEDGFVIQYGGPGGNKI